MASPVSVCSEDFDAAETFAASLMDQIDSESVKNMVDVQRDMLSRFEKTNEMLINFNILSANRFAITSQQYRRHTQLIYEMRRDLDSIFKRIRVIKHIHLHFRVIKHKLGRAYPEAFKVCGNSEPILEDDEEFERETSETSEQIRGDNYEEEDMSKDGLEGSEEAVLDIAEKLENIAYLSADTSSVKTEISVEAKETNTQKDQFNVVKESSNIRANTPSNLVHQHTVG